MIVLRLVLQLLLLIVMVGSVYSNLWWNVYVNTNSLGISILFLCACSCAAILLLYGIMKDVRNWFKAPQPEVK